MMLNNHRLRQVDFRAGGAGGLNPYPWFSPTGRDAPQRESEAISRKRAALASFPYRSYLPSYWFSFMNEALALKLLRKIMEWDEETATREYRWVRLMSLLKYDGYRDY